MCQEKNLFSYSKKELHNCRWESKNTFDVSCKYFCCLYKVTTSWFYEAQLVVALYKTYNVLLLQLIQKTIDIFFIVWQLLRARLVRLDRLPGPVLTFLVCGQPELRQRAVSSLGWEWDWSDWDWPGLSSLSLISGRSYYKQMRAGRSKSSDSRLSQTRGSFCQGLISLQCRKLAKWTKQ